MGLMKHLFKIALITLLSCCPGLLTAKTFEGTVHMTLSADRGESHNIAYSIKDGKVRTDFQGQGGMSASAIINFADNEIIMLMPAQSMYMVMPMQQTIEKATGEDASDVSLENTGITKEILGYTCTKYLAKSDEGVTEIWATHELGTFMGLGNGMQNRSKKQPGWEQALIGKDFFPLLVTGTGKSNFSLKTTAVEPKSLPDSSFIPPANYRKFDMGGMMKGMGGKMFGQ